MEMLIRRAKYEEAKKIKEFDEFIGDRRIDNWRGDLKYLNKDNSKEIFFVKIGML